MSYFKIPSMCFWLCDTKLRLIKYCLAENECYVPFWILANLKICWRNVVKPCMWSSSFPLKGSVWPFLWCADVLMCAWLLECITVMRCITGFSHRLWSLWMCLILNVTFSNTCLQKYYFFTLLILRSDKKKRLFFFKLILFGQPALAHFSLIFL